MKIKHFSKFPRHPDGYALVMVLILVALALLVAGATLNRTYTVARLNNRSNAYAVTANAAEAAVEKVYTMMVNDFIASGSGLGQVKKQLTNSASLGGYQWQYPGCPTAQPAEDPYWGAFNFTDGQGNAGRVYVNFQTYIRNFTGSGYSNNSSNTIAYPDSLTNTVNGFNPHGPVYRILANASLKTGATTVTNAVQVDLWLAMIPLSQFSIFYSGLMEFDSCATFDVYGRVHSNTNMSAGGNSALTFHDLVTMSGTLGGSLQNVSFLSTNANAPSGYKTKQAPMSVSIISTNPQAIIQIPPSSEDATSSSGRERMYNKAQVVLLIQDNLVTLTLQKSVNLEVPGADPSPVVTTYTNLTTINNNLPFLTLTNKFFDQREEKTNITTQIDIGKYATWLTTAASVTTKFPAGGDPPTILFVADNRTTNANLLTVVRITNGIAPPSNGGLGFTLATPNPLYVWGSYNQTDSTKLNKTDTSTGTVPCALMSDAFTVLSDAWQDSASTKTTTYQGSSNRRASSTTINAALVTGVVPTTASDGSGGVHNLPRLLEDWLSPSQDTLTLNTSIICIFNSLRANHPFRDPANYKENNDPYYDPPKRQFRFDTNFLDPSKQPPGIPCALAAQRLTWRIPPPNTVNYNATYN